MLSLIVLAIGSLGAPAAEVAVRSSGPSSSNPGADVLFKFQTGGNITESPVSSPDGKTVYFASQDNNLYAVNPSDDTGVEPTILWNSNGYECTRQCTDPVSGQPCPCPPGVTSGSCQLTISQDGRWLFVLNFPFPQPYSQTTLVKAINATSGKYAWNMTVPATTGDGLLPATPAVQIGGPDGIPYTYISLTYYKPPLWNCNGGGGTCAQSSYGYSTLAECQRECQQPPPPSPPPPPTPVPYSIIAMSAFNPATGALVGPHILPNNTDPAQDCNQTICVGWSGTAFVVSPDGTVGIGSWTSGVTAVNLSTSAPIWTSQMMSSAITYSPDSKMLYAAGSTVISAYSATTGNMTWDYKGVGFFNPQSIGVTLDSKTLIAGNTDGFIYALDGITGAIKWIVNAGGSIVSQFQFMPCIGSSPAYVYLTCTDGVVYALDTTDGTERWSYRTGYSIEGSVAVTPPDAGTKRVYFGADDGRLYGLAA